MHSFKRGDTPTFVFNLGNTPIESLGDPIAVITQGDFSAYLDVTVDEDSNSIRCSLDKDDSVMLIGGFPATVQHSWVDDVGNSVVFPSTEVLVEPAYVPFDPYIKDMSDIEEEESEEEE